MFKTLCERGTEMKRAAYGFLTNGKTGKFNQYSGAKCISLRNKVYLLIGDVADGYQLHDISKNILLSAINLGQTGKRYEWIETIACNEFFSATKEKKEVAKVHFPFLKEEALRTAHERLYQELMTEADRMKNNLPSLCSITEVSYYEDILGKFQLLIETAIEENKQEITPYCKLFEKYLHPYPVFYNTSLYELARLITLIW